MNWILLGVLIISTMFYSYPHWVRRIINAFVEKIDMGEAAIVTWFGKFSRKKKAGLVFKLPIANAVKIFPLEIISRISIVASVQTKDGDSLDVDMSFEYRADYDYLEKYFYATKNGLEEFNKMVENTIITLVGTLASTKKLDEFYKKREAVWMAINCHVRLSGMPHVNPEKWKIQDEPAKATKILEFYEKHQAKIKDLLSAEGENEEDRSEAEKRYGINAVTVDINKIVLSEGTQKALDAKKKDEAASKAAKFKKDLIKGHIDDCGLSPKEAKAAAEVSLGQTTKNENFNISGLEGLIKIGGQ